MAGWLDWGGEEGGGGVVGDQYYTCQGCCGSKPTLHPASTALHTQPRWWELWQGFVHNWKLQFTESNYPEHDFPNIPTEWGCLAHFGRLFLKNPALLLPTASVSCFSSAPAARVLLMVFYSENFNSEAILSSFYHPQTPRPLSAV